MANINPKNAYQIEGDLSAAHDIFKIILTNTKHFEADIHMGLAPRKKMRLGRCNKESPKRDQHQA